MNQKTRDTIKLVVAAMAALAPVLATFGIYFDWLSPEFLNNLEALLIAVVTAGIALYGVWMNTYTRMKAFEKAEHKKAERYENEGIDAKVVSEPAVTAGKVVPDDENTKGL